MRRWSRWWSDDAGSASLEFIVAGVVLLVPIMYLGVALNGVHNQAMGVQTAARQIARVLSGGSGSADAVLAAVAAEYGMEPDAMRVEISCRPLSDPCPAPGTFVTVRVDTSAVLPLAPAVLDIAQSTAIPVEAIVVHRIPDGR